MKIRRLLLTGIYSILLLEWLFTDVRVYTASSLEETTIVVSTLKDELNDDGDYTLRKAIAASNYNTTVDACGSGVILNGISDKPKYSVYMPHIEGF